MDQMQPALDAVQRLLGHRCADAALLQRALTHASVFPSGMGAAERRDRTNERLEFLGDAVLTAVVAQGLHARHPKLDEGQLSRLKSRLVSRATLARVAGPTGLLDHARVGTHLRTPWPDSVKANLVEAILGAIHLDGGWPASVVAVERLLGAELDASEADPVADVKNRLQEWALARKVGLPQYRTERCGGSDHEPEFTSTVSLDGRSATGRGSSRRAAEFAAAEAFLALVSA